MPSVLARVLYGVGEIPITVAMTTFGLFVLFFYASVLQLPPVLAGAGAAVGLVWDAIIDPYIGYRSDRSRHWFGRRHVFMLAGALTSGICFWMLLAPPAGLSTAALFAWLVGTTLLFRTTTAIYRVPYLSLGAEMCHEAHGRTVIAAYRSVFGLVGTLSAATLSFLLFFPTTGAGDPKLRVEGYGPLAATWGAVMTLCGIVAIVGTWRYRAGGDDGPAAMATRTRYKQSFFDALSNGPFRRIFLALVFFFAGVVINAAVGLHFYTWYVGVSDSAALSRIQLCFYTGALVGVPVWTRLARRYERHTLMSAGLVIMAALLSAAPIVFGAGRLYGAESLWALYATHALTGAFAAVAWVMPGAMLAECADAEAMASGQRKEGIFFGLLNLGEKIAAGVAILITGAALQLYAGLASGAAQTPETIERIGAIFAWLPAVFLTMSAIAIYGYRLSHSAPATVQARPAAETPITSAGGVP